MTSFLYELHMSSILIEFAVCILVFLQPLQKKEHYAARIITAVFILIIGGNRLYYLMVDCLHISRILVFFLTFAFIVYAFYFCAPLSISDAVFGASCAYAVQHMSNCIYNIIVTLFPMNYMISDILGKVVLLVVSVPCYFLFAKKLPINGVYGVKPSEAVRSLIIVIPFAFFMSMEAQNFFDLGGGAGKELYILCRIYACICCTFVLWVQTSINEKVSTEVELKTQQMLFRKQREQYELSKDNIDLINRKCHDLKHQISAIRHMTSNSQKNRYLEEIEDSVMIYDSVVKTGNNVLDTILTERSLTCEKKNITWTCMADGKSLGFVDPVDLYTMLGNAIDNAMEAVDQVTDPEKKVISLNIFNRGKMVVIKLDNYYQHELDMENGLPSTSKSDKDYHGIGLHSIRFTANKYKGTISASTEDQIFKLCIILPIP